MPWWNHYVEKVNTKNKKRVKIEFNGLCRWWLMLSDDQGDSWCEVPSFDLAIDVAEEFLSSDIGTRDAELVGTKLEAFCSGPFGNEWKFVKAGHD